MDGWGLFNGGPEGEWRRLNPRGNARQGRASSMQGTAWRCDRAGRSQALAVPHDPRDSTPQDRPTPYLRPPRLPRPCPLPVGPRPTSSTWATHGPTWRPRPAPAWPAGGRSGVSARSAAAPASPPPAIGQAAGRGGVGWYG